MKKIALILLLIVMMSANTLISYAYEESDIISNITSHIVSHDTVSRADCIVILMRILGVDDKIAYRYANSTYDQPVFDDIYPSPEEIESGYIIAANFSGIAVGTNTDQYTGIGIFEPDKNVTLRECVTFILRCLKDSETVVWENVIDDAQAIGLLKADKTDLDNVDSPISVDMFKTILTRMLDMNRYLYWPTEESNNRYVKSMQKDLTGSMRYIDWLTQE